MRGGLGVGERSKVYIIYVSKENAAALHRLGGFCNFPAGKGRRIGKKAIGRKLDERFGAQNAAADRTGCIKEEKH